MRIWDRMMEEGKKVRGLFWWFWGWRGEESELRGEVSEMVRRMVFGHPELFSTLK